MKCRTHSFHLGLDASKMEFCPKCGTRLVNERKSKARCCPKCGYMSKLPQGHRSESMFNTLKPSEPYITVADKDMSNLRTLPVIDAYCEKCGGNKAETWTITVGSNDVSSITFYRCISCGHTWRETD